MKKETLEEVAERFSKNNLLTPFEKPHFKNGFEQGVEWQQERSYSEEDMRGMYNKSCGLIGLGLLDNQTENNSRFKELLEQFKNK